MRRTELLQEIKMMRFREAFAEWKAGRLTQQEAARLLGVCERSFRRYCSRYDLGGLAGLKDGRLGRPSHLRAPQHESWELVKSYEARHKGWTAKHFYAWYQRAGGKRSYTWVKKTLQKAGLVRKAPHRGAHRKRRDRAPLPGMLLHQDGSRHEWVPGQYWDLIVTMDDATNEHYDMRFVEEEGTRSSFEGVEAVIRAKGLFSSLYTDRGAHYWVTKREGEAVDKTRPTQFGRAMQQLGIEMIPAYSPEARGRSERAFRTHQERLVRELAMHGITTMAGANTYLAEHYRVAFNLEFSQPSLEAGSAFVPCTTDLKEVLCEHVERKVGGDNCVTFFGVTLQISKQQYRCNLVGVPVRIHRYTDDTLAVFHGPRCLGRYRAEGEPIVQETSVAA